MKKIGLTEVQLKALISLVEHRIEYWNDNSNIEYFTKTYKDILTALNSAIDT